MLVTETKGLMVHMASDPSFIAQIVSSRVVEVNTTLLQIQILSNLCRMPPATDLKAIVVQTTFALPYASRFNEV